MIVYAVTFSGDVYALFSTEDKAVEYKNSHKNPNFKMDGTRYSWGPIVEYNLDEKEDQL